MTVSDGTWPVRLAASQVGEIVLVANEEAIIEAGWGDPRNVTGDCMAIVQTVRSQRREENGQLEAALTARQWDVIIAALDRAGRPPRAGCAWVTPLAASTTRTVPLGG